MSRGHVTVKIHGNARNFLNCKPVSYDYIKASVRAKNTGKHSMRTEYSE